MTLKNNNTIPITTLLPEENSFSLSFAFPPSPNPKSLDNPPPADKRFLNPKNAIDITVAKPPIICITVNIGLITATTALLNGVATALTSSELTSFFCFYYSSKNVLDLMSVSIVFAAKIAY